MPLLIKKSPDGRLLAKNDSGPPLLLLSRSRRTANHRTFDVRHYLVPDQGISVIAMKGLSMSMLYIDTGEPTEFSARTRGAGTPKPIYYEGRLFLLFSDIQRSGEAWLVNEASMFMSGSNTFPGGKLCLGTSIDPLNLSPLDALCFNRANRDLAWQGTDLIGEWERNPDPNAPRSRANNQIFKVATWPHVSQAPCLIPPQILADCSGW